MNISRYDVLHNEFNREMIDSKALADRAKLVEMREQGTKFGKGFDIAPILLEGVGVAGTVLCATPLIKFGATLLLGNVCLKAAYEDFCIPDQKNENIEIVQKVFTRKFDMALKNRDFQHSEPEYEEARLKIRLKAAKENIHLLHPDYIPVFNIENTLLENKIKDKQHQQILDELQPLVRQMELYGERQCALNKLANKKFDDLIEINREQNQVLEALKKQGVEITDDLKKAITSSEFIQKDVSAILSYLEKEEMDKIHHLEHEKKMASYQGMMEGFAFLSALGNVVGSQDLSRIGQIAHAGVKIFQQAEQLISMQIVGAAVLNPLAGIGMAALSIFSLFQKSQDPNRALMEQLKAISRQIERLHKDVTKKLDSLGEKISHLLNKMLEGFHHLEMSSHVHIESKLSQIQNEIITLTKITQTGFEVLVTKDLFDQMQYVEDRRRGLIKSEMPESKFEIRMGKLSRFISEISSSKLFNGLIYEHLLKQNQGATQQIISIYSQLSPSILHGLLGLLVRFAQENIKTEELQNISPERMVHPGFWQAAVSTYCHMQMFYADKYTYDPQRVTLDTFKATGNELLEVIKAFSNSKQFYTDFLKLIVKYNQEIEKPLQELTNVLNKNKIGTHVRQPKLELDLSDELKNNKFIIKFLTIDRILDQLKGTNKEIPAVFIQAQALGLGHLEFTCHLPVRKRTHKDHSGYAIKKNEQAGLSVIFVSAGEDLRIPILQPGVRVNKHNCQNLQKICLYVLRNLTQTMPIENAISHVMAKIKNDNLEKIKLKALETAYTLQEKPVYHQLLKLNHFLISYLILGGFSDELVLKVRNTLLLHDVAETLANFSKNPWHDAFPKIEVPDNNALNQIQALILREIGGSKTSQIAAHIYLALQNINQCEIITDAISKKSIYVYERTNHLEEIETIISENKVNEVARKNVSLKTTGIHLPKEKRLFFSYGQIQHRKLNTIGMGDCLIHAIFGKLHLDNMIQTDASLKRKEIVLDIQDAINKEQLKIHEQLNSFVNENKHVKENTFILPLVDSIRENQKNLGLEHAHLFAILYNLNILIYNELTQNYIELFYNKDSEQIDHIISYNGLNHWSQHEIVMKRESKIENELGYGGLKSAVHQNSQLKSIQNELTDHPLIVTDQFREKISQLVGHESKFKRFAFNISLRQPYEIKIQFLKEKLIMKSQEIESHLIDLVDVLTDNLTKLSLDQNQFEMEINPEKQSLTVSSHDSMLIRSIGIMLKNAGMGYWSLNQFKYTEQMDEINCAIQ